MEIVWNKKPESTFQKFKETKITIIIFTFAKVHILLSSPFLIDWSKDKTTSRTLNGKYKNVLSYLLFEKKKPKKNAKYQ